MRRFTRLTNAFSKKIENHEAAIALHYMHYNFARIHQTLRVTPAMEAGISNHVWSSGGNCRFVALISHLGRFRAGSMKSKQLANVLIKIIGLYICLLAIPSVLSGILAIFTAHTGGTSERLNGVISYSIGAAVQILVGAILIIKSRDLTEFWFKNEDE